MAQTILLKRSALPGKTPDTGSLQLGEIAINTYDGKMYLKRSGSIESIEAIVTTGAEITGSLSILNGITGSLYGTASFAVTASFAQNIHPNVTASYAVSASQAISSSYALDATNALTASYFVTSSVTSASYAENADLLDGYDSAAFVLSSSYNQFTSSYYIDSASFSSSIAELQDFSSSLDATFATDAELNAATASLSASISYLSSSYLDSSSSFDTRILANSSSIGILSSSLMAFTASYNTGSFTGSFTGSLFGTSSYALEALSSSYALSASQAINANNALTSSYSLNINGSTNHIPLFDSPNSLVTSAIYQSNSYSVIINQDNNTSAAPEALYVWQPSTSSYNVISGKGNLDNYLQLNIQNTNNGVNASSDVVATANNGNESTNYIDMGINNENYNSGFVGEANDAYIYSTGRHLHIGNVSNFPVQIFAGGSDSDANKKLEIRPDNQHQLTGSLDISGSLIVQDGITGSLFGTASFAVTASYAANVPVTASYAVSASQAENAVYAITASYALNVPETASFAVSASQAITASYAENFNPSATASYALEALNATNADNAISSSYAATASYADNFTVAGTLTAQTINVQTITSSIDYVTGSTIFGSELSNTHQFTGSVTITGSLAVNNSNVILTNQTSSMSVLSASYALTASYASNVPETASFAISASQAQNANTATSASYALNATNALTASYFVTSSVTSASYAEFATSASQALNSDTATSSSYALDATNALNAINALTASYILNAISSSYSLSSSYAYNADLLDGKDSSEFATTGSNIFVGNQLITGSVTITGSTVQIGNNTLLGNTSLSGSVVISGSFGNPTNPNIKIYGDLQTDGVIKFTPVSTNIDSNVSGSYIYVSGSTNDLYFTQNGNGYANTTRLRWLEGNLYTGLLNGGLITTQSSTVYQISSGSGIIVNLNASLSNNPYPTIQYLNWPNLSASIVPLTASYQQAFVGIDSTNNIYQQGTPFSNGQFDTIINIGGVFFQNQSTINAVKTQPSVAYGFEQSQNIFNRAFGPLKLSGYTLAPSGSSTGSLVVGSGTAYAPGSNYTIDPNEPSYTVDNGTNTSKIFRYYQSGSTWIYLTNGGAGYTTINPGQYSNNGTLSTVQPNEWSIQRVFWFPNSVVKAIVVYYGNNVYSTEADAIANINIESFVEAPNTAANAIYLGAIIIRGNGTLDVAADFTIVPGGLFRQVGGSGGGGSIVTQTLSGLSDVAISGPTNDQPLVYSTTAGKWINSSNISGSLFGNAQTATSASFASTASYVNAANVDGLTLSQIATGSVSASVSTGTGSFAVTSGSSTFFFISSSGFSGFGTDAPQRQVHIATGSVGNASVLALDNTDTTNGNGTLISYRTTTTGTGGAAFTEVGAMRVLTTDHNNATRSSNYSFFNSVNGTLTESIRISGSGFIGIRKTTITAPLDISGSTLITGSLNVSQGITGSLFGTASYALQALSASYASNADTATSSSYAATASYADNFTVKNTLTAQTLVVSTVSSSVVYSSGSNIFGNDLSNTQIFTGSVSITGSLAVNGTTATLGTGTINTVPKFTAANIIGNSNITDNGTLITLNTGSYVNGNLGVGTTPNSAINLIVEKNITGATLAYGIFSGGTIQSGVTNAARLIQTNAQTAAASFTISNIFHYFANQATFGLGSTVNAQTGFFVESTLTGAVNNFGFRGLIPSGTNRWNIYMEGTADNYLAGALGIGTTGLTGYSLRLSKTITGATSSYGISQNGTVQSDVTTLGIGIVNVSNTQATTFTLGNYRHFAAVEGAIGAGSTITSQTGFYVESNLTTATNNYGFFGAIPSGTNRWNLYMNGTANNYLAGSLGIGSTSIGAKLQVNNAATVGTGASAMSAINPIIFVDNGSTANGSIVIKAHSVGAGNVVGALRFASSPDGINYNWAGIEALSAASATVETLVFKISPSNSSAATSTEIMRIDANGLTIGTQTSVAGTKLTIGGSYGRGAYLNGVIPSTVTSTARYVNTVAQTAAASFTLTNLQHYFAEQTTFGAGSIVTNQFGFYVENNLTGASNNFGFYGNLATSGSRNWNLYMNGTAPNHLAGQLGIGKLPSTGTQLDILGATTLSGSLTVFTGSGVEFQVTNTGVKIGNLITDTNTVTGSLNVSGSVTATNFTGSLLGTASFATTASFAPNATSASYAATSSYADDFTIKSTFTFDATLNDYSSVASSISGTNNIFNRATGSYTSAFFKYTVRNTTNARTGEVMAIWNGANVEFTDFSTRDLGTTSAVTMSVSLAGGDIQFNAITNTSGWNVKAVATFM